MCSVNTPADTIPAAPAHARALQPLARRIASGWLAVMVAFALAPAVHAAPQQRTQFDHLTTGFELIGQHRDLPCEACHFNAVFKGTPRDCAACHGVGTTVRATAKPANHILSTQRCDACHTPIAWKPAVTFDHTQALGSCSSCHNGVQAQGKGATHIDTNLECDACHSTIGWAGAVFNHAGVTSGCARCHDGVKSTGMPPTHIPTNSAPCESCHSTTTFTTFAGTVMGLAAHQAVIAAGVACATCHETAPYLGMKPSTATAAADSRPTAFDKNHPLTGDCGQCHDTSTFANSALRPANHIPTNGQCVQCHTTAGNYALYSVTGTHQGVTSCLSCHGPTVAATFANIKVTTTPGNHIPSGNLDCNGSGCHSTTNVNPGGFNLGAASMASPSLTVAGHTTVAAAVPGCQTCHEAANYMGMLAGTGTMAGDSRPSAALDSIHPTTGDCGSCHTTTPTFTGNVTSGAKPANHIPTTAPCAQCHTSASNYAAYSVTATHQGVTSCLSCHGPSVAGTFANIKITTQPANHIPTGSLDCNSSGCHSTTNVNPGGFNIGSASITSPALSAAGHMTVAAATPSCQTCHEAASYLGMIASGAAAGDSRPSTTLDAAHPTTGDCGSCHLTTPTFLSNAMAIKPANHIPTTAACTQCHTTGSYATYSTTGTHQGVTNCLSCHGPTVAATFANIKITTTPGNHIPFGGLDCNGSGCHSTSNVNPGGFNLGAASITAPTLSVAGHTTVATATPGCQTCHEAASYMGMVAGTGTLAGDSRPSATLDAAHPTTGDCNGCHTTTPTFASTVTSAAKPANHIPYASTVPCAQCHTTAGNYAAYSVTGTHQGVTSCLSCHGPTVAGTFANIKITTAPGNHIPYGSLDCNGSGCHSTTNVNPGGFNLGAASIATPTLSVAGHTTVAAATPGCQTCHEAASYMGMVVGTSTAAGDSRPSTALDAAHPTTGDCGGCHTTTPTFALHVSGGAKPTNHIPTNAPCAQCHTTAGNYAAYVMGATGHAGITSGCAQCHGPGLTFANMAPPTLKVPPVGNPAHIPYGTAACELCHAANVFTSFAGTIMRHAAVRNMTCMSCHEKGMTWYGEPNNWTRPGNGHYAGRDCGGSGCHTPRDKYGIRRGQRATVSAPTRTATGTATAATATVAARSGVATARGGIAGTGAGTATAVAPSAGAPAQTGPFDHRAVMGTNCVSCHNQASGIGKPSTHIATSDACATCHTTLAWLPVSRVDHTQVRGTCVSCHNGTTARGKPSTHVPTTSACDSCHTTNAWTPARFDHATVAPHSCTSCHDAVHAIGRPRNHIPTTQQCDTCHGTLAWLPVKIDHATFTTGCAGCHNNAGAVGKPTGHMGTQRDCATCHTYPDWSAIRFVHASTAYPGQHRAALSCTACHTSNTDQVPYLSPANAGTCGGCHSKDFKPAAHPKTVKGQLYSASELANCSGACHIYSDSTQSTITRSLPGPYHRVFDATFKH